MIENCTTFFEIALRRKNALQDGQVSTAKL